MVSSGLQQEAKQDGATLEHLAAPQWAGPTTRTLTKACQCYRPEVKKSSGSNGNPLIKKEITYIEVDPLCSPLKIDSYKTLMHQLLVWLCGLQEDVELLLVLLWLVDGSLEVCVQGGNVNVEVIQGCDQGREVFRLHPIPGHACVYVDGHTQPRPVLQQAHHHNQL